MPPLPVGLRGHSYSLLGISAGACVRVPCWIWLNKTYPKDKSLGSPGLSSLSLGSCREHTLGQLIHAAVPLSHASGGSLPKTGRRRRL